MPPKQRKRAEGSTVAKGAVQLTWTREMKMAVHIIFSENQLTPATRESVFFTLFKDHIQACGFSGMVPSNRLTAQWAERKKQRADWKQICTGPTTAAEEASRNSLRERISSIAENRASDTEDVPPDFKRLRPQSSMSSPLPRAPQRILRASAQLTSTPTLLSRSAPIAYWNPKTPDSTPSESQENNNEHPGRSRLLRFRPATAVGVPREPAQAESRTIKRRCRAAVSSNPRTPRRSRPTTAHQRPDGTTIMIPPRRAYNATLHPDLVPEHDAHPPLPALLFRYWNEDPESDMNSTEGFVARKWYKSNVVSHVVPKSTSIDMTDVFNHMDRKMDKSPFISTSSRLIWIIQLMMKNKDKGDKNGRVSVINTAALDKRAVFWARPFHDRIIKTEAFSNGAHRYRGTYEFLCWRDIPAKAMVHTFRAKDLLHLATTDETISAALRIEIMGLRNRSLSATKIPLMRQREVNLTSALTAGIAQLCLFFGLTARSPIEQHSHIVSDIIEGYAIKVEYRNETHWHQLAALFASEICRGTTLEPLILKDREKVKLAFLDGIAWGCGEVNARFKQETIRRKQKKAQAVGLSSPAKILTNQLDAIKLALMSYEMLQDRRLLAYHQEGSQTIGPAVIDESVNVEMDGEMNLAMSFQPPTPSTGGGNVSADDDARFNVEEYNEEEYVIRFDGHEVAF